MHSVSHYAERISISWPAQICDDAYVAVSRVGTPPLRDRRSASPRSAARATVSILRNSPCGMLARSASPGLDQALEGAAQFGVLEFRQFDRAPRRAHHRTQPRAD